MFQRKKSRNEGFFFGGIKEGVVKQVEENDAREEQFVWVFYFRIQFFFKDVRNLNYFWFEMRLLIRVFIWCLQINLCILCIGRCRKLQLFKKKIVYSCFRKFLNYYLEMQELEDNIWSQFKIVILFVFLRVEKRFCSSQGKLYEIVFLF